MRGNTFFSQLFDALITIWGVVTLVFFAIRLTGDPVLLMLPLGTPEEEVNRVRTDLGYDEPLIVQYFQFLARLVQGDFGDSIRSNMPASQLVIERLPATAELALVALFVAIILGGVTGILSALYKGTFWELLAMGFALIGQATPVFWLGIMLILLFAGELGWLPSGGRGGISHLILPVVTLALFSSASIARVLRSSLLEVRSNDYVRTARAKGISEGMNLWRHQLRNALIPVVTIIGIQMGRLLGGAVITETIFSWPGVGRLVVQAIENRDFPLVQASATFLAVAIVGTNFVVDMLYTKLDPRIRDSN